MLVTLGTSLCILRVPHHLPVLSEELCIGLTHFLHGYHVQIDFGRFGLLHLLIVMFFSISHTLLQWLIHLQHPLQINLRLVRRMLHKLFGMFFEEALCPHARVKLSFVLFRVYGPLMLREGLRVLPVVEEGGVPTGHLNLVFFDRAGVILDVSSQPAI